MNPCDLCAAYECAEMYDARTKRMGTCALAKRFRLMEKVVEAAEMPCECMDYYDGPLPHDKDCRVAKALAAIRDDAKGDA